MAKFEKYSQVENEILKYWSIYLVLLLLFLNSTSATSASDQLINDSDPVLSDPFFKYFYELVGISLEELVKSVSTMKLTKDMVRNPLSFEDIEQVLDWVENLGANTISIETPYDNPSGGDSIAYTYKWIKAAREKGLNIIHRHMFLKMEGIYDEEVELRRFGDELSEEEKTIAAK